MAPAQPKYEIQGRLLVPVPEIFQLRNDELGRAAVRVMNERYAGNNHVVLDISSLGEGQPIDYLNPYRRFALGPIVRELYGKDSDGRTVQLLTPAQSELALKHGTLPDARSTYESLVAVLYSTEGADAQLARHLVGQAEERSAKIMFPLVIYDFEIVKDNNFTGGLRFDLGDAAVAYHVPILSKGGNFDANDPELVKTGFPSKLGSGSRTLHTAPNDGLRWVGRGSDLGFFVSFDLPFGSYDTSRASFVIDKAPQNLETRLAELNAERDRQTAEVEAHYERALAIMRGQN